MLRSWANAAAKDSGLAWMVRLLQSLKAVLAIFVTEGGRMISVRLTQPLKSPAAMAHLFW